MAPWRQIVGVECKNQIRSQLSWAMKCCLPATEGFVEFRLSSISEMSDLGRSEVADVTPSAGVCWRSLECYECRARGRGSRLVKFAERFMVTMDANETRLDDRCVEIGR